MIGRGQFTFIGCLVQRNENLLLVYIPGDDEEKFIKDTYIKAYRTWFTQVEERTGAKKHERPPERKNHRNGYRTRTRETRVGEVELQTPKLRKGTCFPSLLEPRKPAEKALLAVVQQAYLKGVSTRKVDTLVKELGLTGIGKSKVSRICKELDDNWRASQRRYFYERSMLLITEPDHDSDQHSSALLVDLTTNVDVEAQINFHH